MHKKAGIGKLEQRREDHLLALMYTRTKDGQYIDNTIRVTRQAEAVLLTVPRPLTNKLTKAPTYKGSKLWNSQEVSIRQLLSRQDLQNQLQIDRKHREEGN
jgi:predicted porin